MNERKDETWEHSFSVWLWSDGTVCAMYKIGTGLNWKI